MLKEQTVAPIKSFFIKSIHFLHILWVQSRLLFWMIASLNNNVEEERGKKHVFLIVSSPSFPLSLPYPCHL